jgi:hypothetical protein
VRPPQLPGEARRGKAIHWSISGISERSACFPYRIQSTEAMMNRILRRLRAIVAVGLTFAIGTVSSCATMGGGGMGGGGPHYLVEPPGIAAHAAPA